MAEDWKKDLFTFIWHIENFSMCPLKKGEYLTSPRFVVDVLDKTSWCLALYPKGSIQSDNCVSCFLRRIAKEEEPEEVTLRFMIEEMPIGNMQTLGRSRRNHTMKKNGSIGIYNLISLKTIRESKNLILPNDVLTLICNMKRGIESSDELIEARLVSPLYVGSNSALEEDLILISDEKISTEQCIDLCSSRLRIPVHRKQITWTIKNFKTKMQSVKKIPVSLISYLQEKSKLLLSCYVIGDWDSDGSVKINIQMQDKDFRQTLVRCKATVLDKDNRPFQSLEEEHLFGEDYEVWSFPPVVSLSTIENSKSELLKDDSLTLRCEFFMSQKEEEVTIGKGSLQANNSIDAEDLNQDLTNMSNSQELSDVTLISEEQEIPVHKTIICARSPVFKAMFTNDTEEKRTGVVCITDIDADTLKNMLDYMYDDRFPALESEDTIKLYSAANKYQFLKLKKQCVASLMYNLSVSNVCDVLILADLHQDDEFLIKIHNFLRGNSEVFQSSEWINMMENNLKLAGETMRKLLAM